MAANEIHYGDIGTAIKCTFKDNITVVDISSSTIAQLIFTKPDGSSVTKDGSFFTDGSDGVLQFVTTSGFLDQVGMWQIEGYIEMGGGKWRSDIKKTKVHRVL